MTPELKEILEGLKREYLKNMPDKLALIAKLWKASEIDLLETEFHKLKGTGKTYGLPEISELGLLAEELCTTEPPTRDRAVELALNILTQIHQTRIGGHEFDLHTSSDFLELSQMHQALPK
ncbi:MAG: Hpt domain-containing protein [Bdellovibrionaceae bacterium]|nr:Hpt domain-containing protein [Pseudobdellovibrionaceae bacterium]